MLNPAYPTYGGPEIAYGRDKQSVSPRLDYICRPKANRNATAYHRDYYIICPWTFPLHHLLDRRKFLRFPYEEDSVG